MFFCLRNAIMPANGKKYVFWLKTKLRTKSKRSPKKMVRYLDGLKRKPRQAHLLPSLKETLMAKIGANIVEEFLKKEYQTYHDG